MLLLKSIYKANNTFPFLTLLPARIVTLNKHARIGLLFILFLSTLSKGFAQQDCSIPYVVDLAAYPNVLYTDPGHVRSGNCDGDKNCISYKVLLNQGTDVLAISSGQFAASDSYYIDGDGPYPVNQPACVSGEAKGYVIITFCKPGSNVIAITFSSSAGISTSPDITLRQGCTGSMSVNGMVQSTIKWTSIYPGNPGDYNSYLSTTSGASVVTVTPPAVPPANGYIDYQVTGIEQSPCNTISKAATIRVYMYPALTVSLTSSAGTVCSGNPVTLTATPSGGNPGYTYLWSSGATTRSITVNTAGTYTVSVSDQLSNCGPATASVNITATSPVAPTAVPVTICTGNPATLTATGPGGPYQWYDVNHNLVCPCTGSTITTPNLTSSTTYYVSTTYGGCQSPQTAIPVTVLPTSAAPTAPAVTVCTGNQATLNATAPGGPYQWYDPGGNPVGNGSANYTAPLLAAGTYYYKVTSSVTGCPGPASTVAVTVLPTSAAPTAPPVTVCTGSRATLNATAPGGAYQWYDPGGIPVGDGISSSYTTPLLAAGTYNYTVTSSVTGCPGPRTTVTVTVLPTSAAPTAPPVTVCAGNQATLNATAPGAPYQWYDPSGNPIGNGSSSYTAPLLAAGTYNYTVTSSVTGCPGPATTVTVTVLPTSAAPTAPPVTVCTGSQATLNTTAPGGPYQWYDPGGIPVGDGISSSYTAPLLAAGTYNYTVTSSVTGCPGLRTTVTVTVLPTPPAPTAPPVTVCTGRAADLTATAPGGPYQWYDPNGNAVGDGVSPGYTTPVLTTGATNTTYNYTVTTSFGGCPSQPTTVPVTVTPLPPTPTVLSQ